MDRFSGPLRMDENGMVDRLIKPEEGDSYYEPCGFVGNDYACAPDVEADWNDLLEQWNEARAYRAACDRTEAWSYYDRLGTPGRN